MARKTYKTKSSAQKAKRKGQALYKVKGGWRISSRRFRRHNGWHRVGGRHR